MEFTDLIKTAKVDNVVLWRPHSHKKVTGTLCLTSHHILFSDRTSDKDELMLLYMAIESLQRKLSGAAGILTIFCKDFDTLKMKIPGQEDAFNVAASIEALSTFESASLYYPFFFNNVTFKIKNDGWHLFNLQEECNKIINGSEAWRVCAVNINNEVCGSYPKFVVVPSAANDEIVKKSAKFRQSGRFPVVSYIHKNKVPLLRSSQPLYGSSNKRCKEDEKLLSFVLSGFSGKGQIVDTRTSSVAASQRSKGGGFETSQHYPQWIRTFQNLERPSFLGESISRLYEACMDTKSSSWLLKLDASGWLTCVADLLKVALSVANCISHETPVLVHGDRGSDITLQITSLTQLLLNPECRTVTGFQSLITREWLWAGYAFTERHLKLGISPARRKEHAPVFLLFLDCVHQILQQYPSSFEFTEDLLLLLAQHSYSSEYGTFLFNCEWQREQSKVAEKTVSLWSFINREEFLSTIRNPIYEENPKELRPSVAPQSLTLWYGMFAKQTLPTGPDSQEEIRKVIVNAKKENNELKERASNLQSEYEKLRAAYLETS
ncbi:myotubularin-related protein 9-like [Hydractinia symbiolongicarpus]|uniref:myotubularin-related protein 9-like n=1 Tax=Hydractinia symbiolongicarpus TaxID=13093 RepID=UPI00254F833E|nr:myotubularin-related protein 9-like [Hydractinia symbiolongicarpus]